MREEKMKEAKLKAGKYCAYQERTQQEVRDKLYDLGLYRDEVENVLTELIMEDFVNEERYSIAFALGKFRLKHWGKNKIRFELTRKGLSDYCIEKAIGEIEDAEYFESMKRLLETKAKFYTGTEYEINNRIARFLIGKGYEPDLTWSLIKDQLSN